MISEAEYMRVIELHNTDAMHSVVFERMRQDKKWGEQNHNPERYLLVIAEEFGEVAKSILHTLYGGTEAGIERIRKELVEVSASALAAVESIDRGLFAWAGCKSSEGMSVFYNLGDVRDVNAPTPTVANYTSPE